MNILWAHHSETGPYSALVAFLATRIWGKARPLPEGTVMAVARGNTVIGAALFNNYQPDAGTIEITAAADDARWLTRATLRAMFAYPFAQLGCQAVILRADPANKRLNRIAGAYGFQRHDLPRLRGRDKAEAIHILTDDAWRANRFHKETAHG